VGAVVALVVFGLFPGGPAAQPAEAVIDLSGRWNLILDFSIGPPFCEVDVVQSSGNLSIIGSCDLLGIIGTVNVTGTIDTSTGSFAASGAGDCPFAIPPASVVPQNVAGAASVDGNSITGTLECDPGAPAPPFSLTFAGSPVGLCGNGTLDTGEECDDANVTDGDGCSAGCRVERPDAFTCYQGAPAKGTSGFQRRDTLLTDEFESKATTVFKPDDFCNPTSLELRRVSDLTTHLTCFKIKDAPGQARFRPRDVVTLPDPESPFEQLVTVKAPSLLCLPSEKDGVASELNLNHFKCYRARSRSGRLVALLPRDELGGAASVVSARVDAFCNPVDQDGGGIKHPTTRLMCARISGREPVTQDVVVENDFGEQRLTVVRAERICLPALMCDPPAAVCEGKCGDAVVDGECCENCDPPFSRGGAVGCSDACRDRCGNSVVEAAVGEECDNYTESNPDPCQGWSCQPDCTCAPPGE
jgi:cysteine-rich repeat protein